jgi:hypothetical protein
MQLNHDTTEFVKISNIQIPDIFYNRLKTNVEELDSIFGEGILPGSTMTIIGKGGTGKSIFSLQLAEHLTNKSYRVGYASGEENIYQLAFTCKRLTIENLKICVETNVDVLASKMENLDFLVIDSFQCLSCTENLNERKKVQYIVNNLVKKAKDYNCALLFVVHMTTAGEIKGGTLLPHSVDFNMKIEKDEEMGNNHRIITVYKNRFGPTGDYSGEMVHTGWIFNGVREEIQLEELEKKERVPVSMTRKSQISEMTDPPHITLERVMKELDIQKQTAYNLLRDMEKDGTIKKYGRGVNGVYKSSTVAEKSFLSNYIETLQEFITT